jgi:hypothetical protein
MNRVMLTLAAVLLLSVSSCAFLRESLETPYGFMPAEDAECQWGIIGQGRGTPFGVKAGTFETARPLAHQVTCKNQKGEYINPGSCFYIDCVVPQEPF